jgi:ubiquinone biosynthesis protein
MCCSATEQLAVTGRRSGTTVARKDARGAASSRHRREREIAEVLIGYELSHLAEVLGVKRMVRAGAVIGRKVSETHTEAEKLRFALEALGPTFIKLGQLLSTRTDLLSSDYRAELTKLQDTAPAVPSEAVKEIIERELHAMPDAAFATSERVPLACASVGQAHTATLRDGTDVVVKVRRPNVVEDMEQDFEIIQNLAARADRHWNAAARYDLVGLADEFVDALRAQLDYLQEARNAERFRANFAGDQWVQIPRVFPDLTTSRVITLERIRGMKITDLTAVDEAGLDRHELAERTALIVAKMIFEDGFFHADPHPGNFFIEPTGRVGIIDFGMVGTLDDRLREQLRRLLMGFLRRDPGRLVDALLALGTSTGDVDRSLLREDLENLLKNRIGRSVREISLQSAIGEMLEIVRRHGLRVPRDLSLLFTMLIIAEGVVAVVDPEFQFAEALAPYARRHLASDLTPAQAIRRMEEFGVDLAELAAELPGRLNRISEGIETGGIEVHVRTDEMEALLTCIERLGNRVAASVLAATSVWAVVELATQRRRLRLPLRRARRPARAKVAAFVRSTSRTRHARNQRAA